MKCQKAYRLVNKALAGTEHKSLDQYLGSNDFVQMSNSTATAFSAWSTCFDLNHTEREGSDNQACTASCTSNNGVDQWNFELLVQGFQQPQAGQVLGKPYDKCNSLSIRFSRNSGSNADADRMSQVEITQVDDVDPEELGQMYRNETCGNDSEQQLNSVKGLIPEYCYGVSSNPRFNVTSDADQCDTYFFFGVNDDTNVSKSKQSESESSTSESETSTESEKSTESETSSSESSDGNGAGDSSNIIGQSYYLSRQPTGNDECSNARLSRVSAIRRTTSAATTLLV
jgi:hypothetical protein